MGSTPLMCAASAGHAPALQYLLHAGASPNATTTSRCTALYYAAAGGHLACVDALIAAGAALDTSSGSLCSPLHAAATNGHTPVVKRLIEVGVDVDISQNHTSGCSISHMALQTWVAMKPSQAFTLLDPQLRSHLFPAPLATFLAAPLLSALSMGHAGVVDELLAAGADPDAANSSGNTALHLAAAKGVHTTQSTTRAHTSSLLKPS